MAGDDDRTYEVVVNDEEQYSIWLSDKDIPAGWRAVGMSGTKERCLAYIEEVWTDMRPLSLRKRTAEETCSQLSSPDSAQSGRGGDPRQPRRTRPGRS